MELVCVGCYTSGAGNGNGIRTYWHEDGTLTPAGELAMSSPSWLTWHPTLDVLYAANESADGEITVVVPDDPGTLISVASVPSGGADPCHLTVTPDGRHLLCSNYSSGSLAVFALSAEGMIADRTDLVTHTGSGPVPDRQDSAHVHMAVVSGSIVSAVDLGTDEIRSYTLADDGSLAPLSVSAMPPGTGPRQLLRRPGTDLAYVAGELAATLVVVREGPAGTFTPLSVVPATAGTFEGVNYPAHLEIAGDRLYLSNRGPDVITEFDISDTEPKAVADRPCGAFPRHFTMTDDRFFVAAQKEDAVVSLPLTGGESVPYPTGTPTCVIFR
jgi:6-phosphogluconolactonase (cycloisomerase 2 family)